MDTFEPCSIVTEPALTLIASLKPVTSTETPDPVVCRVELLPTNFSDAPVAAVIESEPPTKFSPEFAAKFTLEPLTRALFAVPVTFRLIFVPDTVVASVPVSVTVLEEPDTEAVVLVPKVTAAPFTVTASDVPVTLSVAPPAVAVTTSLLPMAVTFAAAPTAKLSPEPVTVPELLASNVTTEAATLIAALSPLTS